MGVAGIWLFFLDAKHWLPYAYLALVSGVVMALLAIWSHPGWWRQLKGLAILVKIGMLGLALLWPAARGKILYW